VRVFTHEVRRVGKGGGDTASRERRVLGANLLLGHSRGERMTLTAMRVPRPGLSVHDCWISVY
jgi:hypothetical protein